MSPLIFNHKGVEAAYQRHFSAAQIPLDVVFNGVLSAVTFCGTMKFWPVMILVEKVLMCSMVAGSLAVPILIAVRKNLFLRHRETLLAFKHLYEATVIARTMPRKVWFAPRDRITFLAQWFLFAPQVVWPILGMGFRFLLPGFVLLQGIYLVLIVACNGALYDTMVVAYPGFMRHFMGWPGAKTVLGLGALDDRTATLAVWVALQTELAFMLPVYTCFLWEVRDRQRFGRLRAARLPAASSSTQQGIDFRLAPLGWRWRILMLSGAGLAPLLALGVAQLQ